MHTNQTQGRRCGCILHEVWGKARSFNRWNIAATATCTTISCKINTLHRKQFQRFFFSLCSLGDNPPGRAPTFSKSNPELLNTDFFFRPLVTIRSSTPVSAGTRTTNVKGDVVVINNSHTRYESLRRETVPYDFFSCVCVP